MLGLHAFVLSSNFLWAIRSEKLTIGTGFEHTVRSIPRMGRLIMISLTALDRRPTVATVFVSQALAPTKAWLDRALTKLPKADAEKIAADFGTTQDEILGQMLVAALAQGESTDNSDGYALAHNFETSLGWPADFALASLFDDALNAARGAALRYTTMAWVMRTGTRFGGVAGHTVTFRHEGTQRTGKIVSVDKTLAQARVDLFGAPYATPAIIVFAETVERYHGA